jgi:methylated-DNA-protein-cysteine methyltransferase related protein
LSTAPTEFSNLIIQLIKAIPRGKVATYGSIAELADKPRAARQVGWILHSCTDKYKLPWHRVIKSGGIIPFPKHSPTYQRQKELLEKEGIIFFNGRVDLNTCLWSGSI